MFTVTGGEKDEIKWTKERKLRWEDFEGKMQKNTPIAAVSSVGVAYETITASYERYILEIYAVFEKKRSAAWMEKASNDGLIHEQKHFDLVEVYARKMRKALFSKQNLYGYSSISDELRKLHTIYVDSLRGMQERYDKETHYSCLLNKQHEWNAYIEKELKVMESWSNPYVTVYLKQE